MRIINDYKCKKYSLYGMNIWRYKFFVNSHETLLSKLSSMLKNREMAKYRQFNTVFEGYYVQHKNHQLNTPPVKHKKKQSAHHTSLFNTKNVSSTQKNCASNAKKRQLNTNPSVPHPKKPSLNV